MHSQANLPRLPPFSDSAPLGYGGLFTADQYWRLKGGLLPLRMEGKWTIHYEAPNLSLHRSWTGEAVYRVGLKELPSGAEVVEAVRAVDPLNPGELDLEYEAELLDFLISNLLLGMEKPFPVPVTLAPEKHEIYQHAVCGTGYPILKR